MRLIVGNSQEADGGGDVGQGEKLQENPASQLEVHTRRGRAGRLTAMTSKVWPVFFDSQAEPSRTRICHEPCAMLSKSA